MDSTKRIIDYFYENLQVLNKISLEELRDVVSLATIVIDEKEYDNLLKVKAYKIASYVAMLDEMTIEDRWILYWTLKYKEFVMTVFDELEETMDKVYETIYLDVEKRMPEQLLKNENEKKERVVVIITNQFLGIKHAPTRRVLDYGYTIKKELGYRVVIINTAELNMGNCPYINGNITINYMKEYEEINMLEYKDEVFPFYQSKMKMLNVSEIETVLNKIKQLQPQLILNVGASCITADLCRNFAKTATIPCATSIPRSMAENLVVCRNIRETDKKKLSRIKPWQHIVESKFNYIMPDETGLRHYARSDFGIPNTGWLLTVAGNRMEEEIDDEFLNMVDDVLEKNHEIYFWVIGEIKNKEKVVDKIRNKERVFLAGCLDDGSQAIRLADVYIQPKRKGGGRAAFEALWYGIPVITIKYGDAWDVCGDDFGVDSYEEMKEEIISYYNEKEKYEERKRLSRKRAIELEDMKGTFQKLFEDLEIL